MRALMPQISLLVAGILSFIFGAFIKDKSKLLVLIIAMLILAGASMYFMVVEYTDWIEKIMPLTSGQNWA